MLHSIEDADTSTNSTPTVAHIVSAPAQFFAGCGGSNPEDTAKLESISADDDQFDAGNVLARGTVGSTCPSAGPMPDAALASCICNRYATTGIQV